MIDLEKLERLHAAATPGPWSRYADIHIKTMDGWGIGFIHHPLRSREETGNNVAYIVAACNALPALIERVRELERQKIFLASRLSERCMHTVSTETWIELAEEAAKEAGE